jgi:2-hydroxychromene-2-carboxylate isomerase
MARRPILEFWYEFASTYSYLAAMRIEAMAAR